MLFWSRPEKIEAEIRMTCFYDINHYYNTVRAIAFDCEDWSIIERIEIWLNDGMFIHNIPLWLAQKITVPLAIHTKDWVTVKLKIDFKEAGVLTYALFLEEEEQ